MTTSAAKTNSRAAGFTLVEIVVVLAIAAIVLGGAAGLMLYSSDERVLRDTAGEIELLAKRARTTAILQQTPYAIEVRQNVVRMLPLAQAGQDERRLINGREIGGEIIDHPSVEKHEYTLDPNMEVFVRRWNTDTLMPTGRDTIHIWRFDPDGLCEPLSIRLVINDCILEDTYHPLTGAAVPEERMIEIR